MASLSPAQRRVLEAAQRGRVEVQVVNGELGPVDELGDNGGRRSASITGRWLVSAGLLAVASQPIRPNPRRHSAWFLLHPTSAGLAELGVTDTEKEN